MKQFTLVILLVVLYMLTSYCQQPQWRRAKGTEGIAVAAMDIYRANPDTMYAIGLRVVNGYVTNGVTLLSTNQGEIWDSVSAAGTDVGAIRIDPHNSMILYASVPGRDFESNGVIMSTDGGHSWRVLFQGRRSPAPVIEFDPVDQKTVYVGVGPGFLMRSSDQAQTWDTLYPPVNSMTSLAIAPTNDSIFYLAYGAGIMKSTDKGATWFRIAFSFNVVSVASVEVDPRDANIVYTGVFSFGGTPGGVYKSTDGGLNWEAKNNGLDSTDWHIDALEVNPTNSIELFLGIGTPIVPHEMLLRSIDGGNEWITFDDGLPKEGHISSIMFDTLQQRIYVGVVYVDSLQGIYFNEITNYIQPSTMSSSFYLNQNYPNPFNPQTTITFEVSNTSDVTLKVYDLLGQEVETLLNQKKPPGYYTVTWYARDKASGVYFYQLKAGNFMQTKRMILVK
jgi:hypothetical protein